MHAPPLVWLRVQTSPAAQVLSPQVSAASVRAESVAESNLPESVAPESVVLASPGPPSPEDASVLAPHPRLEPMRSRTARLASFMATSSSRTHSVEGTAGRACTEYGPPAMPIPKMSEKGEKTKERTRAAASERSSTGSAGGASLFVALRKLLREHEAALVVAKNLPGEYELTAKTLGPNGKPLFFGAVRTFRSHTAFYLSPLASDPALLASASEHLRKRFEGTCAFHFKTIEPVLFEELAALTARAFDLFKAENKLA